MVAIRVLGRPENPGESRAGRPVDLIVPLSGNRFRQRPQPPAETGPPALPSPTAQRRQRAAALALALGFAYVATGCTDPRTMPNITQPIRPAAAIAPAGAGSAVSSGTLGAGFSLRGWSRQPGPAHER